MAKKIWIVEVRRSPKHAWLPYEDFSSYFNVTKAQAEDEMKTLVEMERRRGSHFSTEFRVMGYARVGD